MLYKRDYFVLTEKEKIKGDKVKAWFEKVKFSRSSIPRVNGKQLIKYWSELPKAVIFHDMLFPNNYLYVDQYEDTEWVSQTIEQFRSLLAGQHSERDILNFFKNNEAYFFIYEIFREFQTGNHEAYAFREFMLSTNYVADYLLVGKSSGGYEFIFVEFENSRGDITIRQGDFGATIRKGLQQIEDWDEWIDANFSQLKSVFDKYRNPNKLLDDEFFELDKSRIHFALIAGRRNDFKDKTYRLKRKEKKKSNIVVMHYDNLIDYSQSRLNEELRRKLNK